MRNASGTFTVWYLKGRSDDKYEHNITAGSRKELKQKANRLRPNGYRIKAIIWQSGGSFHIWYLVKGKTFEQCWDDERCKLAFGE